MATIVKISQLPKEVQEQIPISIRSSGNRFYLEELPAKIQELIREYTKTVVPVKYKDVFDLKPEISKYSDFYATPSIKETVCEYLKNYFYTLPGSYPFDPLFGCKLKYHLQTKDTQLRRLLISDEVNSIVNVLSSDLGLPIIVKKITMSPISSALNTSISCTITISIPGEEEIDLTINSFYSE